MLDPFHESREGVFLQKDSALAPLCIHFNERKDGPSRRHNRTPPCSAKKAACPFFTDPSLVHRSAFRQISLVRWRRDTVLPTGEYAKGQLCLAIGAPSVNRDQYGRFARLPS